MPSMQETFDVVVEHLRKQGAKALQCVEDNTACAYRGEDGMKCAVGVLIPDDKYSSSFEGLTAEDTPIKKVLAELGHDIPLCKALQNVHDAFDPSPWYMGGKNWETEFQRVAAEFNLEYKRPTYEAV